VKRKPARRKLVAYASCGSNGLPFATLIDRQCPENDGRFMIFDTESQARNDKAFVHKVTILIERERLP
jgi:hypothetical protein